MFVGAEAGSFFMFVMMIFMFPALLLFLAGPGFMALINAFKRMS